MYTKLKYIILSLLIIGIGLLIFNYINLSEYDTFSKFYPPIILIILTIIFFFLPRKLKTENKKLPFTGLGIAIIFLGISIISTLEYLDEERMNKVFYDYSQLECDQLKDKFNSDLKKNDLKFFSGGMFYNKLLGEILKENGIEEYFQGCLINSDFDCYSELVAQYLKKEKQIDLTKLYY